MRTMTEQEIRDYMKNKGWSKMCWEKGSEYLFERWHSFVSWVGDEEDTRNWLIDDYWIFLHIRELIHDVGLDDAVKEDDEIFRSVLTATHIKHRHKERNSDYDFWNYGYPRNAKGFFYEQIKCHILSE